MGKRKGERAPSWSSEPSPATGEPTQPPTQPPPVAGAITEVNELLRAARARLEAHQLQPSTSTSTIKKERLEVAESELGEFQETVIASKRKVTISFKIVME